MALLLAINNNTMDSTIVLFIPDRDFPVFTSTFEITAGITAIVFIATVLNYYFKWI